MKRLQFIRSKRPEIGLPKCPSKNDHSKSTDALNNHHFFISQKNIYSTNLSHKRRWNQHLATWKQATVVMSSIFNFLKDGNFFLPLNFTVYEKPEPASNSRKTLWDWWMMFRDISYGWEIREPSGRQRKLGPGSWTREEKKGAQCTSNTGRIVWEELLVNVGPPTSTPTTLFLSTFSTTQGLIFWKSTLIKRTDEQTNGRTDRRIVIIIND